MIDPDELEGLRRDADRYRWLRTHAVRIQGNEVWYVGADLDIRVDVGRDHVAEEAKAVKEPKSCRGSVGGEFGGANDYRPHDWLYLQNLRNAAKGL